MPRFLSAGKRIAKPVFAAVAVGGLAAWFVNLSGCAPKVLLAVRPAPTSPFGDKYALSYNPPDLSAPNLKDITVAVVNPTYKGEELQESALAEALYAKVARGFGASMGIDLEKVMIAKGLTTTGPYRSIEEITYNEKKNAALTLYPKVLVTTKIKYKGAWQLVATGPEGNMVRQTRLEHHAVKIGSAFGRYGVGSKQAKAATMKWAVELTSGMPTEVAQEWAEIFAAGPALDDASASAGAAKAIEVPSGRMGKGGLMQQGNMLQTSMGMLAPSGAAGLARYERRFTMTTTGWIYFIMQEPMSGEKMWVKKLEIEPIEVDGTETVAPEYNMIMQPGCAAARPIPMGLKPGEFVTYDGKADSMATTLQKIYPTIMKKFEVYLDPAELESLKQKGKEIRALKVY